MIFINEFSEGLQIVDGIYLVNGVTKGKTNSGADYLSINIKDKTSEIDTKLWSVSPEQLESIKAGCFIKIKGNVISYRDQLQMKLDDVEVVEGKDLNLDNFIKTAPLNREELSTQLKSYVNLINDDIIKSIVVKILTMYREDQYDYPAASKNHHAYHGGLMYHTISMLNIANALASLYPEIDTDYLFSGIILHDLGKIEELSGVVATEYTTKGKLVGHISILHAQVCLVAKELGCEESEQVMLLEHMILAHHGKLEYGSPVLPMTREAELINLIDNIDARMDTLRKVYDGLEEGEFSPRVFSLENRTFYKQKK